jgi:hypothetical protein
VEFGYAGFSRFTFLGSGFWIVLVSALAFVLVFAVGSRRGKQAARAWTNTCVTLSLGGFALDLLYAAGTGELRRFLSYYGWGPLVEMAILALLFLGTLWFMAIRYTGGLKD